jgi:hypothetical protein
MNCSGQSTHGRKGVGVLPTSCTQANRVSVALSSTGGSTVPSKVPPTAPGFVAPTGWRVYPSADALQQQLLTQEKAAPSITIA